MIPIGVIAAARTAAGSGHRYWRWTGFAWSGDRVEISELRVVNGSTPIAADMTSSSPPSYYGLYYLTDSSFGSGCTWWNPAGLWIVADLGSAQEVTGMQIGAVDTPGRYPTDITLQYADSDAGPWTTFGVWSGLTYPGNYTAGPVLTPSAYVTDGLVFMLDPSSYSSGQMWGSAPYDFHLGASSSAESSDPTHSGTYWTFDGGDYFTAASAATTFLKGMHKAGSAWTIEAWWYPTGDGGNVNPIFDSGTVDGGGSDMSRGVIFGDLGSQINPQNRWGVRVKQDSGGGSSLNAYLSAAPAANTWHHHAVSFTGGAGCFLWLDGAVAASNLGATVWDGTLSSPGTTDTANPARIGARGDVAFRVANGSRLGILRIYDRALSDTELLQNWNADRATYGL